MRRPAAPKEERTAGPERTPDQRRHEQDTLEEERLQQMLAERIVDLLLAPHEPRGFNIGEVQAAHQGFAREDET